MGQYLDVIGKATLTSKDNALYFKALLNHKTMRPFSNLLSWHKNNSFNRVDIDFTKDKKIYISVDGCFNKLGWYIEDFMQELIDMGFDVNGYYFIHTDDREDWTTIMNIRDNTIVYKELNNISKLDFYNIISNIEIAYINGHICFYESLYYSIKNDADIKYLDYSNECDNDFFIYSDMDVNKVFEIIEKYKKYIKFSSLFIGLIDKYKYLEYEYVNDREKYLCVVLSKQLYNIV